MYKNFTETFFSRKSHAYLRRIAGVMIFFACVNGAHADPVSNFLLIKSGNNLNESPSTNKSKINALPIIIKVSGTVRDSVTNETLPGVSVGIAGVSGGTVTDLNGNFILEVPDKNSIIRFSFVGYNSKNVLVGNQTNITVHLSKNDTRLNEVVVIGYGTRLKGAVTGAISTVKSDVFENRPVTSSFDALQGTIPGLTITKQSGRPGGGNFDLGIRGASSINGNKPLILVDGVPGDINTINTNDIAEVTVLKDAAAAIYGARAADGVIIVTTKRGKKGSPDVNVTSNVGVKSPSYLKKMMNTLEFAEFLSDGLKNVGLTPFPQDVFDKIKANAAPDTTKGWMYGLTNFPSFYGYTDWNKVLYKNAIQQIYNVAISGGGENNNYLISAGYKRDNGLLRYGQNNEDSYNLRLNYDVRINSKLSLETRTNFDNQATIAPSQLDAESPVANVLTQFPFAPLYNSVGQFYSYQGYANPAVYATQGGVRTDNFSRFATNFKLDYNIIPDLKLTGQGAFRFDYLNYKATFPTFTRYNYAGGVQDIRDSPNSATFSNSKSLNKLYQIYLDYNKDLWPGHHINFTGGASLEQTSNTGETITGYNFPNNEIFSLNLADRTSVAYSNFTGQITDQALASYFGRLSYSYNNKFILDLTARADGSSKFAPEKRWSAVFPSAQFAYVLSDENFIKKTNLFDLLKLRLSYGKAGNQEINNLGLYDYIPLISIGGKYPLGSPNAGLTGANANPASSDRTWETVTNKNIGIDVAVLNSRLNLSFDYYNKTNSDMLVDIAVPATFGATPPSVNQGKLATKGFEATVNWKDQIKDFKYSISLQVSDSKNKLIELKNSDVFGEGLNSTRIGYPINSYFGYVSEGIIKTQAQLDEYKKMGGNVPARIGLGDVMYKDLDGDGKITAFGDKSKGLAGDMVYLGDANPRYTFSSNINLAYKGLDLQVFIQGVGKRNVIYGGGITRPNYWFWQTLRTFYGNTYTAANPDAKYPRNIPRGLGYDDITDYDYKPSTATIKNVSYLRFKVITLGYNLPTNITKAIKLKSARIYVSGQDLFTISKGTFDGNFDPEDGLLNEYTYPYNKVYSLGLNVRF
ncbi:TonB-dependent receptor [Mucilaginibacter corticis]|uniref:TonB-dependent receptor n=1 Tax=Mucilaginibacter corticis TaxID=2597670 RepID=A0A556MXA0_9SPHI|nr:TonB-dependent receptor [Mucilaginibacter corticis]TSJ44448.1 TonB-dependent receptor [Mucilaginibacter corticis]